MKTNNKTLYIDIIVDSFIILSGTILRSNIHVGGLSSMTVNIN